MKHNPRLNERTARLPGFADLHPLQPIATVQGALELMDELAHWLCELTGMPAVALSPKAGAHGEFCGMLAIKAALAARGEHAHARAGAASAHGTNPATAALPAIVVEIERRRGRAVHIADVRKQLGPDVAAIMITNPNTCGLFERGDQEHRRRRARGRRLLLLRRRQLQRHRRQGAPGRSRRRRHAHQPAQDLLHPARRRRPRRGAGGAVGGARAIRAGAAHRGAHGTAAWSCAEAYRRSVPHRTRRRRRPLGRMCAFHGQMGMFARALAYML